MGNAQRVIREATARFEYAGDDGETKAETIRVRYVSPTLAELAEPADGSLAEQLSRYVVGLPDITNDAGEPVDVTVELLEGLSLANVAAINKAVTDAVEGKHQTAKQIAAWMMRKPFGRAPDTYGIFLVADRLKQMPETVERMEAFHFYRTLAIIEAEGIKNEAEMKDMKRKR